MVSTASKASASAIPAKTPRRAPAMPRWASRSGLLLAASMACQPAVLDPAGPIAQAERSILFDSLLIMLAIIGPTIAATLAFAWWFRASNPRALRLPEFAYSGRIELVTWAIPMLTITLLGGVAWVGSHELDPAVPLESKAPALEVQVVSLDWKWLFIYPDQHVASVNQLMIPAGRPVHFQLTSASVMDSFFIPQLGSMIYTMNGMASDLNLQADQPGTYWGLSTHLSGDGFSDMHFGVRALDKAGFDAWIDAARNTGPALDAGRYAQLAKQSVKDPPSTFSSVDPKLFQKIVTQELAPGPGPNPEPIPKTKPNSASNPTGGVLTAGVPSAPVTHAMEH